MISVLGTSAVLLKSTFLKTLCGCLTGPNLMNVNRVAPNHSRILDGISGVLFTRTTRQSVTFQSVKRIWIHLRTGKPVSSLPAHWGQEENTHARAANFNVTSWRAGTTQSVGLDDVLTIDSEAPPSHGAEYNLIDRMEQLEQVSSLFFCSLTYSRFCLHSDQMIVSFDFSWDYWLMNEHSLRWEVWSTLRRRSKKSRNQIELK